MNYKTLTVAFLIALIAAPQDATARRCDKLGSNVDAAKSQLRRATLVTDLPSAKDLAREAGKSLEDAASAAKDCDCEVAYAEFDDAATGAKLAADAHNVNEHLANLRRAIRRLNAGVDELKMCTDKAR